MKELTGRTYDIQGFSVQDGPGIRTTVFLKGCPLRCPWCHSPESQEFYPQLSWIAMRCIGTEICGKCIKACPKAAIRLGDTSIQAASQTEIQLVSVYRSLCDNCGECAKVCFPQALFISGEDQTVDALVERVSRDIPFYNNSGGGVTLSGGEPLCQKEFAVAFLRALKEKGIHTALDTTGYVSEDAIDSILPYTDLFLYDLKHMSSHDHQVVIGVPNEKILSNAIKIAEAGGKMQIRIPLIPNFNDSAENIKATAEFCQRLGDALTVIQILPYHALGVMKYQRLDDQKQVLEATPHSDEQVAQVKELLENYGLPVTVH
ncbi:glycyl-radical enzyme activating protein [Actinomycetota bacterium]|nr:glycyl-radical enzyme activating protein [Actinomycetota bacterium]